MFVGINVSFLRPQYWNMPSPVGEIKVSLEASGYAKNYLYAFTQTYTVSHTFLHKVDTLWATFANFGTLNYYLIEGLGLLHVCTSLGNLQHYI